MRAEWRALGATRLGAELPAAKRLVAAAPATRAEPAVRLKGRMG